VDSSPRFRIWADSGIQAKHADGQHLFGVDGDTGKVTDMKEYGLLESASVKIQTLKTAIEVCLTLPPSPSADIVSLRHYCCG